VNAIHDGIMEKIDNHDLKEDEKEEILDGIEGVLKAINKA
jgi:hypothetical protein